MRTDTDTVRAIRHFAGLGYTSAELSRAYGLGYLVVCRIVAGKSYQHVTGDPSARYLHKNLTIKPLPTPPKPAPKSDEDKRPIYKCAARGHQVLSEGDVCMECLRRDPVFRESEVTAIAASQARARDRASKAAELEARIRNRLQMPWCFNESRGKHEYGPLNDGECFECGSDDAALSKWEDSRRY